MCLESRYCSRFASLTDYIDSLNKTVSDDEYGALKYLPGPRER